MNVIWGMTANIEFDESIYAQSVNEEDFEYALLKLVAGGVDDVHTLTLADIAVEIWKHANGTQRCELLYYLSYMSENKE